MDEIQNIYKPYKLILMNSIHKTQGRILWSSKIKTVFSKIKTILWKHI